MSNPSLNKSARQIVMEGVSPQNRAAVSKHAADAVKQMLDIIRAPNHPNLPNYLQASPERLIRGRLFSVVYNTLAASTKAFQQDVIDGNNSVSITCLIDRIVQEIGYGVDLEISDLASQYMDTFLRVYAECYDTAGKLITNKDVHTELWMPLLQHCLDAQIYVYEKAMARISMY